MLLVRSNEDLLAQLNRIKRDRYKFQSIGAGVNWNTEVEGRVKISQ